MKITQEQLAEMIVMMDKDGDGTVDKSEFKTVLLILYPKTTDEEYMRNRTRVIEVWKLVHEVHKKELESDRFDDN